MHLEIAGSDRRDAPRSTIGWPTTCARFSAPIICRPRVHVHQQSVGRTIFTQAGSALMIVCSFERRPDSRVRDSTADSSSAYARRKRGLGLPVPPTAPPTAMPTMLRHGDDAAGRRSAVLWGKIAANGP